MDNDRYEVPYPPTINHYYRVYNSRVVISPRGREYRTVIQQAVRAAGYKMRRGRLWMLIYIYPPDLRKRDIDNVLKALLDAFEHGGAYQNDSQIDDLQIKRMPKETGGRAVVFIGDTGLEKE